MVEALTLDSVSEFVTKICLFFEKTARKIEPFLTYKITLRENLTNIWLIQSTVQIARLFEILFLFQKA